MVRYRRESNCLGWAAFFGVGAMIFVGLVFGLLVLKKKMTADEAKEKQAAAAAGSAAEVSPTRGKKPDVLAREYLEKKVYPAGHRFNITGLNYKEVHCGKFKRNVGIAQVQSKGANEDDEMKEHFLIFDRGNVTGGNWPEWDRVKGEYEIEQDP